MQNLKGILIDSGKVLNFSATGSWNYSPNFFQIVGKDKFYSISKKKREYAYTNAWKYINSINTISTIEEEWQHFSIFFEILSNELPELQIDQNMINILTNDMVLNFDKYTFFKDAFVILPKISEKYKLCIVSDAWPSLRGVYKKAGLDKYFTSMIISSELGITKPNKQMYKAALNELNLKENEVIFIDDNSKNCDGAYKLGIYSIILDRIFVNRIYDKFILKTNHRIIKNLYELENLI